MIVSLIFKTSGGSLYESGRKGREIAQKEGGEKKKS